MSDPDVEGQGVEAEAIALRENLRLALISNGSLGKARAMLRASSVRLLRDTTSTNSLGVDDEVACCIIRDYLLAKGLRFSAGVFEAEASQALSGGHGTEHLAKALGVRSDAPILEGLLKAKSCSDTAPTKATESRLDEEDSGYGSSVPFSDKSAGDTALADWDEVDVLRQVDEDAF